ncbi:MAG: signal peptidase II [Treponema sp.]|jgi:signal peptidase II|nr:signal peptidase II [Treponema sp.]
MNLQKYFTKEKVLPLSLTAGVVLLDQITKAIIAKKWPIPEGVFFRFIKDVFENGFLHIVHVRNKAIAFSLGENLPEIIKPIAFIVFPILVLGFLLWYYFTSDEFNNVQKWAVAGIIGGGIGNILDRIFRPDGVVDFISVRIYGLFGMERWPTFNVADSSVVVCCILLFITIFISYGKEKAKVKVEIDEQET